MAAAVCLAAVGADQVFDPADNHVPLCPFHAMTGLWCPLCGGLRSAYALTRLDFATAVRANVLFVVAVPLLLAFWVYWFRCDRIGVSMRRRPRGVLTALWVIGIVFAVVRNLPAFRGAMAPA